MNTFDYTLLLIESPTLAALLQQLVPQNVLVIATNGYLWTPFFNKQTLKLGKKAIPEKLELRNKIRKESRNAVKIILATDSDPSGDFIAWSLSDDLRERRLFRGNLQAIGKTAIINLLTDAQPVDHSRLQKRLENRYIIQNMWQRHVPASDIRTATVATVFGTSTPFTTFKSDEGIIFHSLSPVLCTYSSTFNDIENCVHDEYCLYKPLSTFKVLELIISNYNYKQLEDAQFALNELFETRNPHTGDGLITYPRTSSTSFFPETWEILIHQWIKNESINEFIPPSLRKNTDPNLAHDSIRPAKMNAGPDYIAKHIPSRSGELYELIHSYTMRAISMPSLAGSVCKTEKMDVTFVSEAKTEKEIKHLTPLLTISGFGHLMHQFGVLKPSGFGAYLDKALKNNIIELTSDFDIQPGKAIERYLPKADFYRNKLTSLSRAADDPEMTSETIRYILTS